MNPSNLPSHIGTATEIHGMTFTFVDEITRMQSGNPTKAIYLQKIRDGNGGIEYRTCWYSLQENGRWQFVNGTMMAPHEDFVAIIQEAQQRAGFL